jgi:1,4-dihydroxy-2-naphthoate octaprenyltransferase
MLVGPTGTGKEVLSKFLHSSSPRKNNAFIAVNCAVFLPKRHFLTAALSGFILAGVAMGLFSMAVLHINNVRDRATDITAGKRTLATRMPLWLGRAFYTFLLLAPFGILVYFSLILISAFWGFFALFIAAPALLITWTAQHPREYVLVLKLTVWTSVAYAALLGYAFAF